MPKQKFLKSNYKHALSTRANSLIGKKLKNIRLEQILIAASIIAAYFILCLFPKLGSCVLFEFRYLAPYFFKNNVFFLMIFAFLIAYLISSFQFEFDERITWLIIFLFAFFVGSIFWLAPEINPDASYFFGLSSYVKEYGAISFLINWGGKIIPGWEIETTTATYNFFVGPITFGTIFWIFGEARQNILVLNTIIFSLTCLITYFIAKRLWNRETGLYAGLLLATFPYLISQVPLMMVDILSMFFVSLTILVYIITLGSRNRWMVIIASILIFFTAYSKPFAALALVGTLPLFTALKYLECKKEKIIRKSATVLLLSTIFIFGFFLLKYDVIYPMISNLIRIRTTDGLSFFTSAPKPDRTIALFYQLGPMTIILSSLSWIVALLRKDKNYAFVAIWILIPLVVLFDRRIRYLIFIYPALAIAASISINALKRRIIRKYLSTCLILTSLIVSVFVFLPHMQNISMVNLKYAAEYTESRPEIEKISIFEIFPSRNYDPKFLSFIFEYYSSKEVSWNDIRTFSTFIDLPDSIVVISEGFFEFENNNLSKVLDEDYELSKVYNNGITGACYPCITTVFEKTGYFYKNLEDSRIYYEFTNGTKGDIIQNTRLFVRTGIYNIDGKFMQGVFQHPPDNGNTVIEYRNVKLPRDAKIEFHIGLVQEVWSPDKGDGVSFQIKIGKGLSEEKIFEESIDPKNEVEDRKWHKYSVDINQYSGEVVDIHFITSCEKNNFYDWAIWGRPIIISNLE